MKKLLIMLIVLVMAFSLAACGGIDPNAKMTVDQYNELMKDDARWTMSCDELEKHLGVKSVVDEDSTVKWGDGYLVVDFPGPDDNTRLHVLFKEVDGKQKVSSYSPTGQFLEEGK